MDLMKKLFASRRKYSYYNKKYSHNKHPSKGYEYFKKGLDIFFSQINGEWDNEWNLENFNKAIELDPKNADSYFLRGLTIYNLFRSSQRFPKDINDAFRDFEMAIILEPNNAHQYYERGLIKFELKDYEGAKRDLDYAIKYDPNDSFYYADRAQIKLILKDLDGFREDNKKFIELQFR